MGRSLTQSRKEHLADESAMNQVQFGITLRQMRYIILVLLIALAALYFTTGIRLGIVTGGGSVQMFNANGVANYPMRTADTLQQIGMVGSCEVTKGTATLRLLNSDGVQLAGQTCSRGKWSVNLMTGGEIGGYTVQVNYKNFTGKMNLQEARQSR